MAAIARTVDCFTGCQHLVGVLGLGRLQRDALLLQLVHDILKIAHGACEPVDARDDNGVALVGDLQKQIEEYPEMAPLEPLPTPSAAQDLEQKLTGLEDHFNALKAEGLAA